MMKIRVSLTSGFRRDVDDICALLGYYAASHGNSLPTFRDNIGPIFKGPEVLTFEDGTDTLSRNVGKRLSCDAA